MSDGPAVPPGARPGTNGRDCDGHRPGLRVLLIEDDADTSFSLGWLLGADGHRVTTARDGPGGLEAALRDRPDVILLDVALPRLNGWEVARRLRQGAGGGPRPLIVAITGLGSAEDRRRSAESGVDLHLVKPACPEALRDLLRRFRAILDERRGRGA